MTNPVEFQLVDAPLRRRLSLKGSSTISIVISQVAAKRTRGEAPPPDKFMMRMIWIQVRPGRRPKKTVISQRIVETEELMWMSLREMADDRLLTLAQLTPPEDE